ncbi:MAG: hypothetical protein GKR90_05755 [Pseudomonadales bacterium]|nr:hypothetical protein [Pseudomonadales bacterium]
MLPLAEIKCLGTRTVAVLLLCFGLGTASAQDAETPIPEESTTVQASPIPTNSAELSSVEDGEEVPVVESESTVEPAKKLDTADTEQQASRIESRRKESTKTETPDKTEDALEIAESLTQPDQGFVQQDFGEYAFFQQQIERGEAEAAQASLEVTIDQIETLHHRYHEDLVEPLTLLGDAQVAQSMHDEAIESYARGRHIARVSHGLFSEQQLPVVYREADVFKAVGDLDAAAEREEYAYEVARRLFAGPDPNVIPALSRLATFYIDTYNPISARTLLIRAMSVHERNGTDTSPEAIPLLRSIAQTHKLVRFPPYYVTTSNDNRLEGPTPSLTTAELDGQYVVINSFPEGEKALQKVVEIQRQNFPARPTLELDAILELADWHLLFGRFQAAHTLYNHVFLRMAEHNQKPEEFFATPTMLYFPRPENPRAPAFRDRGDEIAEGLVSLSFTVTPNGQIRALKTLNSEPEKLMDFRVRRSMRVAKFRPRYVEGEPVNANEQTFTYRFPFYPLRAADPLDESIGPDTEEIDPSGEDSPDTTELVPNEGEISRAGELTAGTRTVAVQESNDILKSLPYRLEIAQ